MALSLPGDGGDLPVWPVPYTTTICYDGSWFGYLLVKTIIFYSLFTFALTWVRHFRGRYVVVLFVMTYYAQLWIHAVLAAFFQSPKPNPHCNPGLGMPCAETQFVWFVVVFLLVHALAFGATLVWWMWALNAVFAVYIALAVWWTGNYTLAQSVVGALVGGLTGVMAVMVLRFALYPNLHLIQDWRVAQWTGITADVPGPKIQKKVRPRQASGPIDVGASHGNGGGNTTVNIRLDLGGSRSRTRIVRGDPMAPTVPIALDSIKLKF